MKIELIKWIDAVSESGWTNNPNPPTTNTTVGFVVYEDDDFVQVATTWCADSGIWNASMSIPRCFINSQETIKEYEAE